MSKRGKFSAEFKREAVQMAAMSGVSTRQVARDLGISQGMLGRWKRDQAKHGEKAFVGQGHARETWCRPCSDARQDAKRSDQGWLRVVHP